MNSQSLFLKTSIFFLIVLTHSALTRHAAGNNPDPDRAEACSIPQISQFDFDGNFQDEFQLLESGFSQSESIPIFFAGQHYFTGSRLKLGSTQVLSTWPSGFSSDHYSIKSVLDELGDNTAHDD